MELQPKIAAACAKRLQIRGFPNLWTEKLSFDEIAWILFDLLAGVGSIDNISVTQSKKDSVIYGVVDMMSKKDIDRVFNELLDDRGRLPLKEWKSTLQFKRLDTNNEQHKSPGSDEINKAPTAQQPTPSLSTGKPCPLREVKTNLSSVRAFVTKTAEEFGQIQQQENGKESKRWPLNDEGVKRYTREEMFQLKNLMSPSRKLQEGQAVYEGFSLCRPSNFPKSSEHANRGKGGNVKNRVRVTTAKN